jgi:hypothetical protein
MNKVSPIKKLASPKTECGLRLRLHPRGRALWLGEIAEFGSRSGVGTK